MAIMLLLVFIWTYFSGYGLGLGIRFVPHECKILTMHLAKCEKSFSTSYNFTYNSRIACYSSWITPKRGDNTQKVFVHGKYVNVNLVLEHIKLNVCKEMESLTTRKMIYPSHTENSKAIVYCNVTYMVG